MEVLDSLFAKARHYSKIGSWEESLFAYDVILKKEKTSTGKKIDATMEMARIELFRMNTPKLKDLITESKRLIELGGDWDRRNRLKVYEALYLMSIRDVRKASALLLDCIATFTCVELCSYKQFMFYALLTSIISLSRNDLRKKVVDNPHVISIIRDLPEIQALLKSIYNCEYNLFFQALLSVYPNVIKDRYLGSHCSYLVREYRILAYLQFLEAYKSVMMSSMAASFGMNLSLLDEELSRFISSGRLNAKIDKVGDVIETNRPDKKNSQYQEVIKKGDVLLNHIQKLVRVIDV
jgi:26S proteasome regulatory subunit N7